MLNHLKLVILSKRDLFSLFLLVGFTFLVSLTVSGQEPAVVQPGAPGEPTKTLSRYTRAKLPPTSRKDVEFMQGMIMHHAQAVEMSALIEDRTKNKDVRLLGARISQAQSDEMQFMKRWLEQRGETVEHKMQADAPATGHSGHGREPSKSAAPTQHRMPGMLTPEQMDALRKAKGVEFDRLFLNGMIQHHNGALVMVKELFDTAGAGQDAELFSFATDVDSGQRAEIKTMQTILTKLP
jgi:uncharacterized protein (DUF305 family)